MTRRWPWLWAIAIVLVLTGHWLGTGDDPTQPGLWPRQAIGDFAHDQGPAYRASLPDTAPSEHAGSVLAAVLEDGHVIGSTAEHDAIRTLGAGRHSFWRGTLYFSASDSSDPRQNGRRYEVAWPHPPHSTACAVAWSLGLAFACFAAFGMVRGFARRRWPDGKQRRRFWLRLLLVPTSLFVCLAAIELTLRRRYPFVDSTWPGEFDQQVGFRFAAGSEIRRTNLFDYCVVQHANSLGFLDREPAPLAAHQRRVVVLGDSFVEAVQVPLDDKFHVRLEQDLGQRGQAVATTAFGMSGCGTANELAFYRQRGRQQRPALVILLLVFNDFANNSTLLEGVRHGWHPEHTPRPFFVVDGTSVRWQTIAADWSRHVVHAGTPAPALALQTALGWSRLYRWTAATAQWIAGEEITRTNADQAARIARFRQRPDWAAGLAGWQFPADLDADGMIVAVDPPPAFREAIALTEHSLAALRDEVAADGGRLLVVFADNLGQPPAVNPQHRPLLPNAYLDLAVPMCARLDLPFVDLHAAFARAGVAGRVIFARDPHWNVLGHATAAAAVADYIAAHPALLGE